MATQTLKGLAQKLRKQASGIDKAASNLAVEVTRAIVTDLTAVTPVDTTTATSNWQVSAGQAVGEPIDAFVEGKGGATQSASVAAARQAAERQMRAKKPGEPLYTSNVVDYIGFLNEGSSKQAPAGFVERSVLIGRSLVKNRRLLK